MRLHNLQCLVWLPIKPNSNIGPCRLIFYPGLIHVSYACNISLDWIQHDWQPVYSVLIIGVLMVLKCKMKFQGPYPAGEWQFIHWEPLSKFLHGTHRLLCWQERHHKNEDRDSVSECKFGCTETWVCFRVCSAVHKLCHFDSMCPIPVVGLLVAQSKSPWPSRFEFPVSSHLQWQRLFVYCGS